MDASLRKTTLDMISAIEKKIALLKQGGANADELKPLREDLAELRASLQD